MIATMPRGDPSFEFVHNTWTGTQQAFLALRYTSVTSFNPGKQMPPGIVTVACFCIVHPVLRSDRFEEWRGGGDMWL